MASPTTLDPRRRKALGAFYTPLEVVRPLVEWAVQPETERILDPSFGDGRFLAAAGERLCSMGVRNPGRRLFGVEIESSAAASPEALRKFRVPRGQLMNGDFLATDLDCWDGRRFGAVLGNPPYVRHHLLEVGPRRLAQRHAARVGIKLNERADAWAYFCAALLDYLEPSGRLAVLLPGAVLHADYALPLLHALSRARGHVQLVRIQQRLFADALERTIVLLIDGQREEPGVDYREVPDAHGLASLLNKPQRPTKGRAEASMTLAPGVASTPELRLRTRLRWFLDSDTSQLWERIVALPTVRTLGAVANLRIGVVTGVNSFFVVSHQEAARFVGRGVRAVPVVSRGGWLSAPLWTCADQEARLHQPSRLLLVDPKARLRRGLLSAITAAEAEGVHERSHCRSRKPWYSLKEWATPELFLPYMGAAPSRLILNVARATCTNAIHRVDIRPGQASAAAVAAASWTSLYRLSAELVGRSYGGGVLKLELGEAALLRLPLLPDGAGHLLEITDVASRLGLRAAQQRADELLLRDGLGISEREIDTLDRAAANLQRRRGH